jgi:hypothetical protein
MRFFLVLLSVCLLAGCGVKTNGPLNLYFIGSTRFTTGNRANVGPGDTLATRLYGLADTTTVASNRLTRFRVTVDYLPQRAPFAYPPNINLFISNPPSELEVVYLDTMLSKRPNNRGEFLFTSVFGARTTTGTERWTYTLYDSVRNTQARSFVLAMRRADSVVVYHDYLLKLPVPANTVSARRFLDLKSGLALPAYSVVGGVINNDLQKLTDVIVLPDGLRLVSPDSPDSANMVLNKDRWPTGNRSQTRFQLTTLTPTNFNGSQDVVSIQSQFTGPGRAYLRTLAEKQVYAFRVYKSDKVTPVYGLMLVNKLPNGTSSVGLQLQIRLAKQPLPQ